MCTRKHELALALASYAHEGQKDRGGVDYINHPKTVSAKMDDETGKIVALLHDVLEDTDVEESTLRNLFGDEIADTVRILTHKDDESYDDYIQRISRNKLATRVKMADLQHNMDVRRLPVFGEKDKERLEKYRRSYETLAAAMSKMENEGRRMQ